MEKAQFILVTAGLKRLLSHPKLLPSRGHFDRLHESWRLKVIAAAKSQGLSLSHGVAAKLINVYLKAGLTCGGYHENSRVKALHPPVDSELLEELKRRGLGAPGAPWKATAPIRWSKFDSDGYQKVIDHLRALVRGGRGFWKIEEYWPGYSTKN